MSCSIFLFLLFTFRGKKNGLLGIQVVRHISSFGKNAKDLLPGHQDPFPLSPIVGKRELLASESLWGPAPENIRSPVTRAADSHPNTAGSRADPEKRSPNSNCFCTRDI